MNHRRRAAPVCNASPGTQPVNPNAALPPIVESVTVTVATTFWIPPPSTYATLFKKDDPSATVRFAE